MGRNNYFIENSADIASTARILGEVTIGRDAVVHDFVTIYPKVRIAPNVEIFEGAVIGKPPTGAKVIVRHISSDLRTVSIGEGCVISPHAIIYTDVEIGDGTLVGDNATIREQCRIGKQCLIGKNVALHFNTTMGDFSKIMDSTAIAGNTIIGSHVFISTLVATVNDNTLGLQRYDETLIRGPVFEDRTRVGAGAIILPGVRVCEGSLVGAGAVVTRDVPPKKLVMGIPARIVRDLE